MAAGLIKFFHPKIVIKITMLIKKFRPPLFIPILRRQLHGVIHLHPGFGGAEVIEVNSPGNFIRKRHAEDKKKYSQTNSESGDAWLEPPDKFHHDPDTDDQDKKNQPQRASKNSKA